MQENKVNATDNIKVETQNLLIAARLLLSDEENWNKGKYALTSNGEHKYGGHPDAVCWCSKGALQAFHEPEPYNNYQDVRDNAQRVLHSMINKHQDDWDSTGIVSFNDNERTTHEDILNLFDAAIASLDD